jgi:hypothetical protein
MAIVSFTAGESISADDVVSLSDNGLLYKAIATDTSKARAAGVAIETASVGNLVRVNVDSIYDGFSGLVPGDQQYLSLTVSGGLATYSVWQSQFNSLTISGVFLTAVGRALSSTALDIELSKPLYVTK